MKRSYKRLISFIVLVPIVIVVLWGIKHIPSQSELCKQGVELYSNKNFRGKVLRKFIDKENHNNKTVIIKENESEKIIFLDADIGGVYEYISIGDNLMKNKGELFVSINRNNLDTIFNLKFRCY
jgi:hypothetical protein